MVSIKLIVLVEIWRTINYFKIMRLMYLRIIIMLLLLVIVLRDYHYAFLLLFEIFPIHSCYLIFAHLCSLTSLCSFRLLNAFFW
jgi:hypothetical protein